MLLYLLGSFLVVLCGIQYKIIINLGTLQAQINSMNVNNVTDGAWTEWGPWSSCSATCGGGLRSRYRSCTNPAPSSLGTYCSGESEQYELCSKNLCLDGVWTEWGPWSSCSATCGGGLRSRNRSCTNSAPSSLGTYCGGESEQYELCSKTLCLDADLVSRIVEKTRIKVAFTAFLSNVATHLSNHQVIPFDKVILNEGQGFNVNTHIFTCPVSGTYNFQTSVFCTFGSLVLTEIVKEGNRLVQAHAEPSSSTHVQGFNSVFTKCDKGENVWVRLDRAGDKVHSERYTTFSGFLLWEYK